MPGTRTLDDDAIKELAVRVIVSAIKDLKSDNPKHRDNAKRFFFKNNLSFEFWTDLADMDCDVIKSILSSFSEN